MIAVFKNGKLTLEKKGSIFFEEKTAWTPINADKLIEGERYIFVVEQGQAKVLTKCRK